MTDLFDIHPLLGDIANNALVLTPNRRLTAKAIAAYSNLKAAEGKQTWQTPRIFSLEGWIQQCWEELQDRNPLSAYGQVLDPQQELMLWEQVITQDEDSSPLLRPSGAASHCQSAYRSLRLWNQSTESAEYLGYQVQPDIFAQWVKAYEQRCMQHKWIHQADATQYLIDAFNQQHLEPEPLIVLAAFQDQPPIYKQLIQAAGKNIKSILPSIDKNLSGYIQSASAEEEIRLAAQWARQVINSQRDATVGIIVPELNSLRNQAEGVFRDVFQPDYSLPTTNASEPPFNMSIGISLANTPVIHSALTLIEHKLFGVKTEQLRQLFYSPFLTGFDDELDDRIQLEQKLRYIGKAEFRLQDICHQITQIVTVNKTSDSERAALEPAVNNPITNVFASSTMSPVQDDLFAAIPEIQQQHENTNQLLNNNLNQSAAAEEQPITACPSLLTALTTLCERKYPHKATPGYWAQWFHQLLLDLGWPGDRSANSLEYQQINQWYELLNKLARYGELLPSLGLSEALILIRKETQAAIFQPMTTESPLQILGPLEAAGLKFTHLWITGMSDDCWPKPANPNPMLAVGFQRQLKMPNATAERELEFARDLTRTYLNSAQTVVFSYPAMRNEQLLRPSALISHLPQYQPDNLPLNISVKFETLQELASPLNAQLNQVTLTYVDTSSAPAISNQELANIRGGSSVIKNQALCPFSAFARHRLNATPLEEPITGLSAAERGNSLHLALELFWKDLRSLSNLRALSDPNREALLESCTRKAITPLQKKAPKWMGTRFWNIENQRLFNLMKRWIEVECQRSDFKVQAIEQTLNTEIAGLPLTLRIDRIDQLSHGETVLIDYKTGTTNPNKWGSERPREPQLPLYAVSSRKEVSAIAFAELNAKEVVFKGISNPALEPKLSIQGIKPLGDQRIDLPADWSKAQEYWRNSLESLVRSFLQGSVPVDPLDTNAYDYSGLEPLNRIYEFESLAQFDQVEADPVERDMPKSDFPQPDLQIPELTMPKPDPQEIKHND